MNINESKPKIVTYPTGLVCEEIILSNDNQTLKIKIARDIKIPKGIRAKKNNYIIDGSMIPKGTKGFIQHQSIWGGETTNKKHAFLMAYNLFRKFEDFAK